MKALKTSLINIRRAPYQAFIAIVMMTLTFFVSYCLSITLVGADQILKFFESRPQVIGFFQITSNQTTIDNFVKEIKTKPFVAEVKVVSKNEALELYKKENQDNPLLLELVTADILPASIEVSATDITHLPDVKSYLDQSTDIEEVVLQRDIIDTLINWTNSIRTIGLAIITVLGITSFFIVTIVIGFKAANHKTAIGIMSLIGATPSYIVMPFMYEGAIYAMLGSIFGWLAMYLTLLYTSPWLQNFLGNIITFPLPSEIFLMQLGIGTATGIFFGSLASLTAVKRMIKK